MCLCFIPHQKKESKDQVTIAQLRWRNQHKFGHKELDAVLREAARDPPRYEVTLANVINGIFYFF